MAGYLQQLTTRLAEGIGQLSEARRAKHIDYLLAAQQPDGGLRGREGGGDLYYTGFALRSLAILGELYGKTAERAADFLRARLSGRESIVDFLSLIYSAMLLDNSAGINLFAGLATDWRNAVDGALENLRRPDGGYAKAPEGAASSTYHTFLVLLCRELIERPVERPDRIVEFLMSQRAEEGGFREIKVSKRAGTNPTAAAIGSLKLLGSLDDEIRSDTVAFLSEMQSEEGGLRANTRIPVADLLSSFTGLLTLIDLDARSAVDSQALLSFARTMERETGGFRGAELDPGDDVEYTFYGLGCLALLSQHQ